MVPCQPCKGRSGLCPNAILPSRAASARHHCGHHMDFGTVGLCSLLGSLGQVTKVCRKTCPCSSTPWVSPNYCCWQGPSRTPLLYVPTQRLRLLLLFHLLFAHSLCSLSIKERIQWVGTHEKLKCVITYSPFEPVPSRRVICFLTLPGDRGALCVAFINLHPTQTSLLREVIKIKISGFCLKTFPYPLSHQGL